MDSNLLALIPYVLTFIAAMLALFFKNRADKAGAQNIINQVKINDASLQVKQTEIENQINTIENQDDSKLTPEERAARWNK